MKDPGVEAEDFNAVVIKGREKYVHCLAGTYQTYQNSLMFYR